MSQSQQIETKRIDTIDDIRWLALAHVSEEWRELLVAQALEESSIEHEDVSFSTADGGETLIIESPSPDFVLLSLLTDTGAFSSDTLTETELIRTYLRYSGYSPSEIADIFET